MDLDGSINTLEETKDYYNNLKHNIFKLKNMEYAKTGCLKLLALAKVLDYRIVYPMQYRCKDVHYVRSKSEKFIDDALFETKKYMYMKKELKMLILVKIIILIFTCHLKDQMEFILNILV